MLKENYTRGGENDYRGLIAGRTLAQGSAVKAIISHYLGAALAPPLACAHGATAISASSFAVSGYVIWPCHHCKRVMSPKGSIGAIPSRDSHLATAETEQYVYVGKGSWGRKNRTPVQIEL